MHTGRQHNKERLEQRKTKAGVDENPYFFDLKKKF